MASTKVLDFRLNLREFAATSAVLQTDTKQELSRERYSTTLTVMYP